MNIPPPKVVGHGSEQMEFICYAVIDPDQRPVASDSLAGPGPRVMYAKAIFEAKNGLFLFSCDEDWNVMFDTFHFSLEEAQHQAEFEHTGISSKWVYPSKRGN